MCIRYKGDYQVQPHLHQMRKINFGVIGKQGKDGKPRTRLKGGVEGSSVMTYRNQKMKEAHLPLDVWNEQKEED